MSLKSLASETAVYGISSILGRLLNFVLLTPFVTRVLSSEQYGVISDLFFYTAFFIAFLVFRLDTAVFRFANRAAYSAAAVCRDAQKFVWALVILVCGGGLLLAPQIAHWMLYPDRVPYIQLFLLIIAFDALAAVPLARLRLEQRPWMFAGVNLINIFVNLVLVYLALKFIPLWREQGNYTFDWYADQWQIAYFFGATLLASIARYLLLLADRWRQNSLVKEGAVVLDSKVAAPNKNSNTPKGSPGIKAMLSYAAPLVVVALAGIINTLVGPTMLRRLYSEDLNIGEYWAGQYGAAMKLAVFLNLFITAYNYAAEPFFFRRAGNDPSTADRQIYADAFRGFTLVNSLAVAGILLLQPIAQLYLGEELREGLDVLPILLAANFLLGIYYNLAVAYKLTDKTMLGGGIALIGTAIVLSGNSWLIPKLGMYAPAWSSFACFLVMCILAYVVSRKYFPVPYPLGRAAIYVALTILVVLPGWQLSNIWLRGAMLLLLAGVLLTLEFKWLRKVLR